MILDASVDGRALRVEVRGRDARYTVTIDGAPLEVEVSSSPGQRFVALLVGGESHDVGLEKRAGGFSVLLPGERIDVDLAAAAAGGAQLPARAHGPARLSAPMPGRVVRVLVAKDDEVGAGQGLVVVEAMKMENEIRSPRAGRVQELAVREGQAVEAGALLAVVA